MDGDEGQAQTAPQGEAQTKPKRKTKPAKRPRGRPRLAENAHTPGGAARLEASLKQRHAYYLRRKAKDRLMFWLERYRQLEYDNNRLVETEKIIAEAIQTEIVRRLEEAPEKISDTALIRMKDSAINTVARKEQWDKRKDGDPKDALSEMARRLAELNGTFKVEVSFPAQPETIDITPTQPQLEA